LGAPTHAFFFYNVVASKEVPLQVTVPAAKVRLDWLAVPWTLTFQVCVVTGPPDRVMSAVTVPEYAPVDVVIAIDQFCVPFTV